ncbi:MAG: hypothetical protein GC150_03355 [Rhizobiales bacterium]|nr:hypothetical protein [Hyphomicrobiales bacterium]
MLETHLCRPATPQAALAGRAPRRPVRRLPRSALGSPSFARSSVGKSLAVAAVPARYAPPCPPPARIAPPAGRLQRPVVPVAGVAAQSAVIRATRERLQASQAASPAIERRPRAVPDETTLAVRHTTTTMAVAALILAAFNSSGLVAWIYDIEAGPLTGALLAGAEGWHGLMEEVGLAGFKEPLGEFVQELHDLGWSSDRR